MGQGLTLLRRLPPKDVIISVIMTLLSAWLFWHVGALEAQLAPDGLVLPHQNWAGYDDASFWGVLEQIGADGRQLYITAIRWDFGLISVVTFSLLAIGYFGLGTTYGDWRLRDTVLLLPVVYGTADVVENIGLMMAIAAFEAGTPEAAAPLSLVTQVKFACLLASLAFLPLASIRLARMLKSES